LIRQLLDYGEGGQAIRPGSSLVEAADASGQPMVTWSTRAIRNYLNKHAGTPTDPLKDVEIPFGEGTIRWEEITDRSIKSKPLRTTDQASMPEAVIRGHMEGKISADEPIYNLNRRGDIDAGDVGQPTGERVYRSTMQALTSYLSHVGDYLRQNVAPEKLAQYDLVRAVKETAANDARVAKEMERAAQASMKDLPVYKEYPQGYKWVELKAPEKLTESQAKTVVKDKGGLASHPYVAIDPSGKPIKNSYTGETAGGRTPEEAYLAGQLAQEGNQMGHCVGGYCEGVASGESKIYSLRDAKGKSHVTVEVAPQVPSMVKTKTLEDQLGRRATSAELRKYLESEPDIVQIKGKQNRAPNSEYLPYVQDFVKSGKWGEVGDLSNTGLIKHEGRFVEERQVKAINELHKLGFQIEWAGTGDPKRVGEIPSGMLRTIESTRSHVGTPQDVRTMSPEIRKLYEEATGAKIAPSGFYAIPGSPEWNFKLPGRGN